MSKKTINEAFKKAAANADGNVNVGIRRMVMQISASPKLGEAVDDAVREELKELFLQRIEGLIDDVISEKPELEYNQDELIAELFKQHDIEAIWRQIPKDYAAGIKPIGK